LQLRFFANELIKGVWLKKDKDKGNVTPIFVDNLKECLTWEVLAIDE